MLIRDRYWRLFDCCFAQIILVEFAGAVFATTSLPIDLWMWCLAFGTGELAWGQVCGRRGGGHCAGSRVGFHPLSHQTPVRTYCVFQLSVHNNSVTSVAAWLSGRPNGVAHFNEINRRRARLVLRWVTVFPVRTFIDVTSHPGQLSLAIAKRR